MKLTNRHIHLSLMGLAMMAAAALTSCSSDDKQPLEVIPADVDFVIAADGQMAADQIGMKWTDDGYQMPDGLKEIYQQFGIDPDMNGSLMAGLHKSIDVNHTYVFGYAGGKNLQVFSLSKVTDKDLLEETLTKEYGEKQSKDGYDIYNNFAAKILVKDGLMWAYIDTSAEGIEPAVKAVNGVIEKAEKANVTSVKAIAEQLEAQNAYNVVVKSNKIADGLTSMLRDADPSLAIAATSLTDKIRDGYTLATINCKGASITTTAKFVDPEGNVIEMPLNTAINTDFLKYIPANYNLVAALALSADNLNDINKQIASNKTGEDAADVTAIVNNLEGTIGFGLALADSDAPTIQQLSDSNKMFVVTIATKPGKAMESLTAISNLLTRMGEKTTLTGSTLTAAAGHDMVKITAEGDMLVAANHAVTSDNANNFAPVLTGNDIAAAFTLPMSGITGGASDYTVTFNIGLANNVLTSTFALAGCDKDLISGLIDLAMAAYQNMASSMNDNADDSFGGFDPDDLDSSYTYYGE